MITLPPVIPRLSLGHSKHLKHLSIISIDLYNYYLNTARCNYKAMSNLRAAISLRAFLPPTKKLTRVMRILLFCFAYQFLRPSIGVGSYVHFVRWRNLILARPLEENIPPIGRSVFVSVKMLSRRNKIMSKHV